MTDTITLVCTDTAATQKAAAKLGAALRGGETLELISDLGGGKTTFVKGLARGLGVTGVVQSPTFTLSQIHQAARGLELHHFDFYRLQDAGVMAAELAESLHLPNAVVAIEWGDIVHDILPTERITIRLRVVEGETREISFGIPKKYAYVRSALAEAA